MIERQFNGCFVYLQDDIGFRAAKLKTYAQSCDHEVLAGVEPMIKWLIEQKVNKPIMSKLKL